FRSYVSAASDCSEAQSPGRRVGQPLETEGGRVRTRTSGQRFFWTTGGAERHRPRQESLFEKTSKEVDPNLSLRPGACRESRISGGFSHSTQLRRRPTQAKRRIPSRGYACSLPSH